MSKSDGVAQKNGRSMGYLSTPQRRDLPVGSLTTPEWHRPINPPLVEHMVKKYDRDALGFLVISERQDGTLAIMDGAMRAEAVRRVEGDDASVPCKVYTGLTLAQEADGDLINSC